MAFSDKLSENTAVDIHFSDGTDLFSGDQITRVPGGLKRSSHAGYFISSLVTWSRLSRSSSVGSVWLRRAPPLFVQMVQMFICIEEPLVLFSCSSKLDPDLPGSRAFVSDCLKHLNRPTFAGVAGLTSVLAFSDPAAPGSLPLTSASLACTVPVAPFPDLSDNESLVVRFACVCIPAGFWRHLMQQVSVFSCQQHTPRTCKYAPNLDQGAALWSCCSDVV